MILTPPTRITLVRHGHVHNPDNVVYGRLPGFDLSEIGRQQAAEAAEVLRDSNLAALYASPQPRAQQTAEILVAHHPDLTIQTEPLIDEVYSFFEGRPAEEVEARGWNLYTEVGDRHETPKDIAARAGHFILRMRERYAGRHVVAVTHGDIIAFSILWAMHAPIDVKIKGQLDSYGISDSYPATASLTTLVYETNTADESPKLSYARPYGEDLVDDALSG
ncbi:MAG: histidine phosphatase family protein [Anaerolineae bacterium]